MPLKHVEIFVRHTILNCKFHASARSPTFFFPTPRDRKRLRANTHVCHLMKLYLKILLIHPQLLTLSPRSAENVNLSHKEISFHIQFWNMFTHTHTHFKKSCSRLRMVWHSNSRYVTTGCPARYVNVIYQHRIDTQTKTVTRA